MQYASEYELARLDLDMLAWEDTNPPIRKPLKDSAGQIALFIETNEKWIIEGCYSDLLAIAIKQANEVIFLNPGLDACIDNCRNRPWKPHKYESAEKQEQNLDMLLD